MQKQTNKLMRRKIIAAAIHAANAVSVAIGDKTNVLRMFTQVSLTAAVILLDRFGIDAAEERIVCGIQGGDFATGAGEHLLGSCAGA